MAGFENVANLQNKKLGKKNIEPKNSLIVSDSFILEVEHFKAGGNLQSSSLPMPDTCAPKCFWKGGRAQEHSGYWHLSVMPKGRNHGQAHMCSWWERKGAQRDSLAWTAQRAPSTRWRAYLPKSPGSLECCHKEVWELWPAESGLPSFCLIQKNVIKI